MEAVVNPETMQDLEQRSASNTADVPDGAPPAEHWMGVIGQTEPVSSVAESEA